MVIVFRYSGSSGRYVSAGPEPGSDPVEDSFGLTSRGAVGGPTAAAKTVAGRDAAATPRPKDTTRRDVSVRGVDEGIKTLPG